MEAGAQGPTAMPHIVYSMLEQTNAGCATWSDLWPCPHQETYWLHNLVHPQPQQLLLQLHLELLPMHSPTGVGSAILLEPATAAGGA